MAGKRGKAITSNFIEDIAMIINDRKYYEMTADEIIEKMIVLTSYNRFQCRIAYRIIFKNGKIRPLFNYYKYNL